MVVRMRVLFLAVLGGWLGLVGPATAVFPPPIKDDGKFFSKDALARANQKIRAIYEKYKKDVVIETLSGLTPEQEKQFKEEGRNRFLARLALLRSRELGLNGIHVLIIKKPSLMHVHMDPDTQKKSFTTANRKTLIDRIVSRFKENNFDAGLLDGLATIETALKGSSK